MAITLVTLTGNVANLVGTDFDSRRTKVWLEANTDFVVDEDNQQIRLGRGTAAIESDGSFTFTDLIASDSADVNPTDIQYRLWVDYSDSATRQRVQQDFGWWSITADADAADLIDEQYVEPSWQSNLAAAVEPQIAAAQDPLTAWRDVLATTPSTAKIVGIGDSTMDSASQAGDFYARLRLLHTQQGGPLEGMTGTSSFIISRGQNGSTLAAWLADATKLTQVVSDDPDLIIASWGINDVREGATTQAQLTTLLTTFVNSLRNALPGVPIALRIPSAFTTTNTGSNNYVRATPGGSINPAGAAQSYSTILRQAYLALIGTWPDVLIIDTQALVMGTQSVPTTNTPLMGDQIHPSVAASTVGSIPYGGGQVAVADVIAEAIGKRRGAFPGGGKGDFQNVWELQVGGSSGNNFVDLQARQPNDLAAAQYAVNAGDTVFIEGLAPFAAPGSGNTFRPQASTSIRMLVSGTDFTAYRGRRAWVAANHPPATTEDRQIVSVNLPSIAAGAIGTVTATVTGAKTSNNHDSAGVVAQPPNTFVSAGLVCLGAYASADNTVTVVALNPTGGAIDQGAENWCFWVVR